MARGSHKLGYLHHELVNVPQLQNNLQGFKFESIPMNVGDVLIFNFFTVHRSGHNINQETIRISAHFRYNDILEPTFIQRKMPVLRTDIYNKEVETPGWPDQSEMEEFILSELNPKNES